MQYNKEQDVVIIEQLRFETFTTPENIDVLPEDIIWERFSKMYDRNNGNRRQENDGEEWCWYMDFLVDELDPDWEMACKLKEDIVNNELKDWNFYWVYEEYADFNREDLLEEHPELKEKFDALRTC